eukprot:TRINITY_DN23454_c0_g2_i1.p1 TRINITY_DN23454_c0_g2~~TRINITY_DN23454_c0_g2_i1.p1  ORF type:complete len:201 (-),score=24.73 TRINITY_DN23454_c0_g2_i1:177-779(-)
MKAMNIFCTSPASTAICLNLHQRQGRAMREHAQLLGRQDSSIFDPSALLLDPQQRKDRPRKSTDSRRRSNADQESSSGIESKPRRSFAQSNISLGRFSCSNIDPSAIVPYQPKSVQTPVSPRVPSSPAVDETVVLRVSIHCPGCALKVRKHIAKMEGVTSISIDLPKQKVTVCGNVTPSAVLQTVSRVKNAEFWPSFKST